MYFCYFPIVMRKTNKHTYKMLKPKSTLKCFQAVGLVSRTDNTLWNGKIHKTPPLIMNLFACVFPHNNASGMVQMSAMKKTECGPWGFQPQWLYKVQ